MTLIASTLFISVLMLSILVMSTTIRHALPKIDEVIAQRDGISREPRAIHIGEVRKVGLVHRNAVVVPFTLRQLRTVRVQSGAPLKLAA